jgi:predicted membrane-bound dolichyl-phosphate-mannose-protein mannosyltransferase
VNLRLGACGTATGGGRSFAGFYAFNPVPLMGFAAEAHFDSLLIFFILLALWLRERRWTAWSWAALGLAATIERGKRP